MLVGLQGSGKTTTTGKLANLLRKQGKNPLLVACDVYRPAAIKQLQVVGSQLNIPVYANLETWNAMEKQKEKIDERNVNVFENDSDFSLNELTIHPFSTPHDAANPCGFNIHNGKRKLSIATDLGHMDNDIFKELIHSSFVLLESNYEPEMLNASRYPFHLKQRIKGPYGHLSNETAGKTIAALMKKDLKQVMLGHLSKENNVPELAYQTVVEELMRNNSDINTISLSVANRNAPGKIIEV